MSLPLALSDKEFKSLFDDCQRLLGAQFQITVGYEHFKGAKILSYGDVQKMASKLKAIYELDEKNMSVIFTKT
jgi:hypothetical protein